MVIEIKEIGESGRLLALAGKFNMYTVPSFQAAVEQALPADRDVILDLERVPHIDSSALGTIIRLQLDLQTRGRRLLLVAPSRSILEILGMTGTQNRFQIYASESDALADF